MVWHFVYVYLRHRESQESVTPVQQGIRQKAHHLADRTHPQSPTAQPLVSSPACKLLELLLPGSTSWGKSV